MNVLNQPRPPSRRPPLGDATTQVNNTRTNYPSTMDKSPRAMVHQENLNHGGQLPMNDGSIASPYVKAQAHITQDRHPLDSPGTSAPNPRLSAISKEENVSKSNRNSQISTTSTNASDGKGRRKTHIGPWHLGKTLGKGATARVRMARHAITGQPAAIKIVQKKNAQISQAGSLASLDRKDAEFKEGEGVRRMPYGIEREVAIMKLIEHPHIMKLYDIWENRTEIYLVLEYVDNGELFDHISRSRFLPEEEALKYFRQLLSAVGYCHQFNICHRDLKPENILLTRGGDIKIADFGMAALQQTPEHRLVTSCGSPHYAAPEVIKAVPYKGDKVDIWSMGVILYATLSGSLPFDNPSLPRLLATIQKGRYRMPSIIGSDASDLIRRMLQLDPRDRITISQIWRHPLLRKYEYLDNYSGGIDPRSPNLHDYNGRPVLRRSDIDRELLRHLKSLWHHFEEAQLIQLLLNDEANDQKLFYSLLVKHQESQLENYTPDIGYSNSDYHHVRPLAEVKKLSTRQFSQPSSNGHRRQVSRFTVVSNSGQSRHLRKSSGADSEAAETVQSYDPFKASRQQNLASNGSGGPANIIVYRNAVARLQEERFLSRNGGSIASSKRSGQQSSLIPRRVYASRSSLASSTRSRSSNAKARTGFVHKRGVSFPHVQRQPKHLASDGEAIDQTRQLSNMEGEKTPTRAASDSPIASPHIRSRKSPVKTSKRLLPAQKPDGATRLFQEDVRQLSSSLAKDCDEAFNRFSALSTVPSSLDNRSDNRYSTPFSSFEQGDSSMESSIVQKPKLEALKPTTVPFRSSYEDRPLPPPPARSESINVELATARKKAEGQKVAGGDGVHSPRYLDRMVSHIDRLMQPGQTSQDDREKRVVSAPMPSKITETGKGLPAINEYSESNVSDPSDDYTQFIRQQRAKDRVASAPESRALRRDPIVTDLTVKNDNRRETLTAWAVPPSSPSPIKVPAPLNIRKASSQAQRSSENVVMSGALNENSDLPPALSLRHHTSNISKDAYRPDSGYAEDPYKYDAAGGTLRKKTSNWFKRNSKSSEEKTQTGALEDRPANIPTIRAPEPKRKSFALASLFKKRSSKEEDDFAFGSFELQDDDASIQEYQSYQSSHQTRQRANGESSAIRQIEPQQNWLARMFRVKPAKKYMCFTLSKRRARQEVVFLLKDWRQYGIKDIVVDKQRNIVFGKVAAKNFLHLKEVAFACEIMTVIEHGKRGHLSIARFTQETGAASSFHKVVETMQTVFKARALLVSDERKSRMMVKTLTSA